MLRRRCVGFVLEWLKHRGPDWSGLYQHGDCYLAHQRLAIVDPASGDQPLYNEDKKIVVTVNGEIYNHEELRRSLSNHKFRTGSDCDVIAHLYEEHGENFVDMLDGIFSFVLLDTRDNSFLVARDAIGITSLYIGWGLDGSVWISSELKGLHDECEHFESFPPGHLYSSKSGCLRRWYNPPWFSEAIPSTPYDPLVLSGAFENAVTKRLMTDVPFGVLLSGGLDSSLVASITSRYLAGTKAAKHWGAQLHSFCVGLEVRRYLAGNLGIHILVTSSSRYANRFNPLLGQGSPDLKAAREVADYLGTVHHEFHFTVQDGIDAIEDVIYHIETYDVTTIRASTPMFLMSRKIKSLGVKMVISGEGSDEILVVIFTSIRHPTRRNSIVKLAASIFCTGKKNNLAMVGYSWIDGLKAHADLHVNDKMMLNAAHIFPHNTPTTKEAYYYRMIFERFFPQNSARLSVPGGASVACSTATAVEWDAAWSKNLDPSGRAAIGVHNSAYEKHLVNGNLTSKIIDSIPLTNGVGTPGLAIRS
ncbi:UNVERIFIED_CONTAM: Asparagine synthetase [glutamine-hydrolyzing] [Sesamum calycinum]|uniref:Asparagine synthetase [glutamine-hydrolyzing] n=1 Tax=Sesamum calycinum TaxID=2727403 RepID=A0AAW2S922_9LAMI